MAIVVISMTWIRGEFPLIIAFALLGMSAWYCHGTATMLASLFPIKTVAYLQIGFRSPEIYVIVINRWLDLGKDATIRELNIFYQM
jgi:hypothetical protein